MIRLALGGLISIIGFTLINGKKIREIEKRCVGVRGVSVGIILCAVVDFLLSFVLEAEGVDGEGLLGFRTGSSSSISIRTGGGVCVCVCVCACARVRVCVQGIRAVHTPNHPTLIREEDPTHLLCSNQIAPRDTCYTQTKV